MIRWQCECGRAMAVKPEHAGKRVRCPDCETVQRVPEEEIDEEVDEGITERPRRSRAPSAPRKRRRERERVEKSGAGVWIWASLAAALFLVVGGVALWFFVLRSDAPDPNGGNQVGGGPLNNLNNGAKQGGGASSKTLRMVPADAPVFGTVALGKLWNGPQGKRLHDAVEELEKSQNDNKPLPIKMSQIDRITFILHSQMGSAIFFISTNEPFELSKVTASMGQTRQRSVNGKVMYEARGSAVHFVDNQLFVVSDSRTLPQYLARPSAPSALDNGPLQAAMSLANKHMGVVGVNTNAPLLRNMIAQMQKQPNQQMSRMVAPLGRATNGLITLDMADDLDLKIRMSFANANDANQGLTSVTQAIQMGRGQIAQLNAMGPNDGLMSTMLAPLDSILKNVDTKRNGNEIELAMHVGKQSLDKITSSLAGATKTVRASANRIETSNNFKQLGLAFHNHASAYRNQLPLHAIYSKDGKRLLSWRVTLLPFVAEDVLYRQFRLNEPWDSPHNIKLLTKMPKIYELSGHPASKPGHTFVQIFTGPKTLFPGRKNMFDIGNIADGSSNTIFTVQAAKAVPWTKPADIVYSPKIDPRTQLGRHYGRFTMIGLCDGSVRQIPQNISEETLRNAIMPGDGQVLGPDW